MADFDLGRAKGTIALDYDPKGGTEAKRDVADIEKSGKKGAAGLGTLGKAAALAGAGVAAGLAFAVNAAANFEQRLSGIQAVTGATAAQMELVRQKALKLGADTKFSADEAAQAIEELSKAGISLPDILNGAADATVALAAAGEIDLPAAATIAANAMNQFGLAAKELPRVADLIAGAANASAIDVGEFAQSMQQAGAAAHLAGITFPDLATAIALMGNAGIKGSDAGTSLKTMLLNLNPQTKKQIDLMKKLGIVTKTGANNFFDAQGKAKSLADISQVLQDSLKGMTKQQQLATLSTLFGSDAIRAAAVLANQGAKGFTNMAGAMGKVKAADVAATRMNNLKGQIEQMKGSLETAAIVVGTILIPALTQLVKRVTGIINAFSQLSPSVQKTVVTVLSAVAAFLIVGGTILKIISVVRDLSLAFQVMWASALGPVAIVIAVIAAVAAVIFILYRRVQPVHDAINALGQILLRAFNAALPTIMTIVAGFQNFLRVLQGTAAGGTGFVGFMGRLAAIIRDVVIPAIIAVGQWIARVFGPVLSQVISIVSGFVTGIIGYFQSILPQLTTIFNAIIAVIRFAFNLLSPVIIPIIKFIFNFIVQTLELLVIGIRIILAGLANIFRGVFNIIGGIIKIFLSLITGQWGAAWQGVLQVVRGILQIILGVIQTIVGGAIVAICVSSLRVIGSVFRGGFLAIRSVVTGAMNGVRAVISGGMAAARAVVAAALGAIRAVFTGNLGALGGIAIRAIGLVRSAFSSGLAAIRGIVSGGLSGIVSAVTGLGGRLFAAGAEIISRLAAGILSKVGSVVGAVKGAVSKAMSFLPGSPVKEGPARVLNHGHSGGQIMTMLADGITARASLVTDALRKAALPLADGPFSASVALAGSASRTGTLAPVTVAPNANGPSADGLAAAVVRGLTGARFEFGSDGLARIVAGSLVPSFVMGGKA